MYATTSSRSRALSRLSHSGIAVAGMPLSMTWRRSASVGISPLAVERIL
jgi:hypothetical protein